MKLKGANVVYLALIHICYGYSLSLPRTGKFSVDRARENEIPMKYWNGLQQGNTYEEDGHIYTPDMVLGPDRKGDVYKRQGYRYTDPDGGGGE